MTVHTPSGLFVAGPAFDLNDHFSEVVHKNYLEFVEQENDSRKMFNAITSLYHFHETLFHFSDAVSQAFKSMPAFRDHVRSVCSSFDYAEAICIYYKHAKPHHKRATQISENIAKVNVLHSFLHGNNTPEPPLPGATFWIDFTKPRLEDQFLCLQLRTGESIRISEIATDLNETWGAIMCEMES